MRRIVRAADRDVLHADFAGAQAREREGLKATSLLGRRTKSIVFTLGEGRSIFPVQRPAKESTA
jgi:hypothetical protein